MSLLYSNHSILTFPPIFLHTFIFLSMFLYLYPYSFYTFSLFILHSTFTPTVYFPTVFLWFSLRFSYGRLYSLLPYGLLLLRFPSPTVLYLTVDSTIFSTVVYPTVYCTVVSFILFIFSLYSINLFLYSE